MKQMAEHCADNNGDRMTGQKWEKAFCLLAVNYGKCFTPHQIGRAKAASAFSKINNLWKIYLLPDITIWTAPGEHHEIKHKNPTRDGYFGLERYRLDALVKFAKETNQSVLYTIHNWEAAGAKSSRDDMANRIDDWVTADISDLGLSVDFEQFGDTYVSGEKRQAQICYWRADRWVKLADWWTDGFWAFR